MTIISLSQPFFSYRRINILLQTKEVIFLGWAAAQAAETIKIDEARCKGHSHQFQVALIHEIRKQQQRL